MLTYLAESAFGPSSFYKKPNKFQRRWMVFVCLSIAFSFKTVLIFSNSKYIYLFLKISTLIYSKSIWFVGIYFIKPKLYTHIFILNSREIFVRNPFLLCCICICSCCCFGYAKVNQCVFLLLFLFIALQVTFS